MKVTVAICTWNRARLLDQTLAEMRKLRIPSDVEWELLVVNNNCTDDTDDVISRYEGDLPLRRLFESAPGLSNARNRAQDEADGDLIVWTDDDVLVDDGWLAAVTGAAGRYPQAAGFGGPVEPWFPEPPEPDLFAAFACVRRGFSGLNHQVPEGLLAGDQQMIGANMAFRRSWVLGLRFNPNLGAAPREIESKSGICDGGGEESEFMDRLHERGGEFIWVPEMRVRHYVSPSRLTLSYLSIHLYEAGRYMIRYKGIPDGPRLFGVPRWIWRRWLEGIFKSGIYRCCHKRALSLSSQEQVWIHRGMMTGCWEQLDR
jgi:glucosyl-dolichyl phosphate glucuronosyltransferase